jgi:hypothetical protein
MNRTAVSIELNMVWHYAAGQGIQRKSDEAFSINVVSIVPSLFFDKLL